MNENKERPKEGGNTLSPPPGDSEPTAGQAISVMKPQDGEKK